MRVNTIRLRLILGWLALLLPWIVALLVLQFPSSISATWYTNASTAFMIILGAASILLMSYKGYEKIDDIILTLSGIFGLGICLFPCGPDSNLLKNITSEFNGSTGTFLIPTNISSIIHLVCAIVFFGLLAYNSFFLFTKGSADSDKNKKIRNIIYRVCGIGMLASFLMLFLPDFYIKTWLMEAIALLFFGISFLTKANVYPWLFCDPEQNTNFLGFKKKGDTV